MPGPLAGEPEVLVVRFVCPDPGCGAVWQILPAFLPRHLWRRWAVIEAAVPAGPTPVATPPPPCPPVPARTRGRWRARLASAARLLVQVLATAGGAVLEALAAGVGLDAARADLVAAYAAALALPPGRPLAALAGHVHRLDPGLRLM
jgi:hypothetical protein